MPVQLSTICEADALAVKVPFVGAAASAVNDTAVAAAPVPPELAARIVTFSGWASAAVMPVLLHVKPGLAPDTVADSQLAPPSMLYSQAVTGTSLLNAVARLNGLLTKIPD